MKQRLQRSPAITILLVLLILVIIGFVWFIVSAFELTDTHRLASFIIGWGSLGPIVIIVLAIIAALTGVIPSYPLTLLAGGIWGVWEGSLYTIIGMQTGAVFSFFIARYAGFPWIERILKKHLNFYNNIEEKYLVQFVFVSRLLPFFVFELISYGAGLTRIKFAHYFWATFFGMIPITIFLSWSGKVAFAEGGIWLWVLTIGSLGFLFVFPYVAEKYQLFGMKKKSTRREESKEDA